MVEIEQQRLRHARRAAFEDYRRRRVSTWIAPRGTSMRPLIGADTWMQVEFGAAELAPGDIILFPVGDILVAHRIVARKLRHGRQILIPKGDAEPYADPPIQPADVLGVVRAIRDGHTGNHTALGCAGRSARAMAVISCLQGRAAALLRRLAYFLPDPTRRLAANAIPPFTRVVARIFFTPFSWAAWLDRSRHKTGRG